MDKNEEPSDSLTVWEPKSALPMIPENPPLASTVGHDGPPTPTVTPEVRVPKTGSPHHRPAEASPLPAAPPRPLPVDVAGDPPPAHPPAAPPYAPPAGDDAPYDPSFVPEQIKGWSWPAFIFGWIWGIFNGVPMALLQLIPFGPVGLAVAIWLGITGNEQAWKGKRWDNVAHFKRVQAKWRKATIIWLIVLVLLIGLWIAVTAMLLGRSAGTLKNLPDEGYTVGNPNGTVTTKTGGRLSSKDNLLSTAFPAGWQATQAQTSLSAHKDFGSSLGDTAYFDMYSSDFATSLTDSVASQKKLQSQDASLAAQLISETALTIDGQPGTLLLYKQKSVVSGRLEYLYMAISVRGTRSVVATGSAPETLWGSAKTELDSIIAAIQFR